MNPRRILAVVLMLALIGVVVWAVTALLPLPYPWPTVIIAVAVILSLLWVINEFGGGLK